MRTHTFSILLTGTDAILHPMTFEAPKLQFQIRARYEELGPLRQRLRDFLGQVDFPLGKGGIEEVLLAVDEAVTNILRHGYSVPDPAAEQRGQDPGVVDIECAIQEDSLFLRFWDDGIPREEDQFRSLPPRTPGESGMGLEIMRHIMDELRFQRTADDRNLLVMRRSRGPSTWSKLE